MFLAPDFVSILSGHALHELDAAEHTVIGLRANFTVGYRNHAWSSFARVNGAPELIDWNGTPITEVFHSEVRSFYVDLFETVQRTGSPADHDYECSSPDLFRIFRLRVLPLAERSLLLLHHLRVERAHDQPTYEPNASMYRGDGGYIVQCCHCRRTRRAAEPATWDWVPAYLDRTLPDVSHGLCPPCFRHYFPDAAAARDRATERS